MLIFMFSIARKIVNKSLTHHDYSQIRSSGTVCGTYFRGFITAGLTKTVICGGQIQEMLVLFSNLVAHSYELVAVDGSPRNSRVLGHNSICLSENCTFFCSLQKNPHAFSQNKQNHARFKKFTNTDDHNCFSNC